MEIMKNNCLLLLLFGLVPVLTIYVEDGCDVKSEWEVDYKWNEIRIGSWVPREEDSTILIIEIEIEGATYPTSFDKIVVYSRAVSFTRRRKGHPDNETTTVTHNMKKGRWADFEFIVDSRYSLMYLNSGNETIFQKELDSLPTKMRMKGSNITVNCLPNSRVWYAEEGKFVTIPMDDQKVHKLFFYSDKTYLVDLVLGKRIFPLGWHNEALTMIPELVKSLPRFEEHQLELVCHANDKTTCDLKIGENRTVAEDNIHMSSLPISITIKSRQGRFAVIRKDPSVFAPISTPSESKPSGVVIALFCTTSVLFFAVVILSYFVWTSQRGKEQKDEESKQKSDVKKHTEEGSVSVMDQLLRHDQNVDIGTSWKQFPTKIEPHSSQRTRSQSVRSNGSASEHEKNKTTDFPI